MAMPGQAGNIPSSLLVPLYIRAQETQRPDALIKDDLAVSLVQRLRVDFEAIGRDRIAEETRLAIVLRSREFDRLAQGFLTRFPDAVVAHIGCGLDGRFARLDNGRVCWYDLDLPEVIALRRELVGGEQGCYHLLACSALDPAWMDAIDPGRPLLVLAEGIFMFFEEAQVRALALGLQGRFPGAELVFDAFSPFFVWANNRRYARSGIGDLCKWGLKRPEDLEGWGSGIRLQRAWYPFQSSEPRLRSIRWLSWVPLFGKTIGVFHYRLGDK